MMNYLKYLLIAVGIILSFFVLSSVASAGGSCFATSPTTASFQLTGCPNPGHGGLYFVDSPFWWSYTVKSSYAFCNGDGTVSGLAPGTAYNFSGFDSNNLPRGSCSLVTPSLTGTVRVMPNIASATWTLTGPATNQSGTGSINFTNKNTGVYSITWNNVAGYTKAITTQSFSLTSGGMITFSNTYTLIPVVTAPTVSSPTVSSITTSSAILGANVTSNGGAPITARGTCWGTTTNPTTNCIPQGGTTTGIFSHVRTGMPAGTTIYYRGYATNSAGTGYSPSSSFTTLWLDLTAGAVTPTTAIAGVSTTFSSIITNAGTSGTGASITNLFQFDDDIDHITSIYTTLNAPLIPPIPANSTANVSSTSYIFPNVGTWYVRVCADNNTAFVGTIAETNEGNNCGAWTPVTVSALSGVLTAPDCFISAGFGSCISTVSWSITLPVPPNSVRQNGVSFSSADSSVGTPRTLSYGSHTFTLHTNNGTTLLDTDPATASCAVGTSWDGSVCAVPPVFSCTGVTPLSATIYVGDDVGLSANTPKTYSITDTPPKCQFSCNAGFSWNGTSCVASSCGDSVCNGTETLLTCPRDCKTKVIQF